MESVESQRRVSHSFHRPLEISRNARDSHIPTARLRGHGKVENPRQVSHFPTAARDDLSCSLSENQNKRKEVGHCMAYPLSPRSNATGFMLIVQLENAEPASRNSVTARMVIWFLALIAREDGSQQNVGAILDVLRARELLG